MITATGEKYGKIKGILWHQGENDANKNDIPFYKNRLSELFIKFREITENENLPILIGELGSYFRNNENCMKINEQIRLYATTDKNVITINTSDLKDKGDKVHFDSGGQRTMGQRFTDGFITKFK